MKLRLLGLILTLALFGLFSCNQIDTNVPKTNSGTGSVVISLTDAPFPYDIVEEANITIDWVKLHRVDSLVNQLGNKNENGNGLKASDSVFVMMEKDTTLNLLDLSNGITAVLSEMDIPAGTYNELRLHVTEASVKVVDDTTMYRLKIPSGEASGIKVKIRPWLVVEDGVESEVLLDFDVNRSFKIIGNTHGKKGIKGFMFKPIVRAINLSTAGKVEGMVTNGDGDKVKNAMITLYTDTDTIASSKSTVGGYYAIIGVPEGTYSMSCERDGYVTEVVDNVDVQIGNVTTQDFVLTK